MKVLSSVMHRFSSFLAPA